MDNILFTWLHPFLKKLNDGIVIRKVLANFVRLLSVLILIAVVVAFLYSFYLIIRFGSNINMDGFVAFKIVMYDTLIFLFLIVFAIFQLQIAFYHAKEIEILPNSPFTITPIISILIKLTGEIYAFSIIIIGILTFLIGLIGYNSFISNNFGSILNNDLLGGFEYLARGEIILVLPLSLLSAFAALIIFYFFAELLVVITDIAVNVRLLLNIENNKKTSSKSESSVPTPTNSYRLNLNCPSCSNPIRQEDIFCENCGQKLK